jgi:hypothetical protein
MKIDQETFIPMPGDEIQIGKLVLSAIDGSSIGAPVRASKISPQFHFSGMKPAKLT